MLLYVISATLAGVAGMLQAAQLVSASPIIATGYGLQVIAGGFLVVVLQRVLCYRRVACRLTGPGERR